VVGWAVLLPPPVFVSPLSQTVFTPILEFNRLKCFFSQPSVPGCSQWLFCWVWFKHTPPPPLAPFEFWPALPLLLKSFFHPTGKLCFLSVGVGCQPTFCQSCCASAHTGRRPRDFLSKTPPPQERFRFTFSPIFGWSKMLPLCANGFTG